MLEDNFFQTFRLEAANIRGRVIRLGSVLDKILGAHDYPLPIAHLVAETITLSLALSSMLKYEGIFTLQAQGDGALKMLVSDVTSAGIVRACASFDADDCLISGDNVELLKTKESSRNNLMQYLGSGHIAFTVDQGKSERYQGIVELKGASMVDCIQHYFQQSEQISTSIKMAVAKIGDNWHSSAIILQHMPEDSKIPQDGFDNMHEDDWRRASILLDSCTEGELLDSALDSDDLLLRLFHDEGVRTYDRKEVTKGCRCDESRVKNILYTMSEDDINHISTDGKIEMTCEFCSKTYELLKSDVLDAN